MPTDKLLELEGLTKYFYKPMGLLGRRKQVVQSVDHVSLHILRHETFGLVASRAAARAPWDAPSPGSMSPPREKSSTTGRISAI